MVAAACVVDGEVAGEVADMTDREGEVKSEAGIVILMQAKYRDFGGWMPKVRVRSQSPLGEGYSCPLSADGVVPGGCVGPMRD